MRCLPGAASTPVAPSSTPVSSSTASAPSSTPTLGSSSCSTVPATFPGFSNSKLPDPFTFANGSKVMTISDWECRRNEIFSFIQAYEAGYLPPKPPVVTGTFSGNTLTVTAGGFANTSSISFANTIKYPSGTAPAAGWPLLIALDGGSIPVPAGIAVLSYNEGNIAQQTDTTSRSKGLFYNLYGSGASASAMTAWAWGVSRIIDALEVTPAAKIDVTKIAVTGCSRDGKGALTIGAFEPRIALTIAQESGSGGAACWRLSLFEQQSGAVVQTATEIVTENVWFSPSFNSYVNQLSVLPFDHHMLAALIAPRPLLAFDNTDYVWLSPVSNYGCMTAARMVYQALGVQNNLGFVQQGGHSHCAFPSTQTSYLNAFFNEFLLGQSNVNTDFFVTNNIWGGVPWVQSNWINWAVPTLA
ncbi:hypothetical protein K488DRAFT_55849 [Vararia minispora EC-137]|uniref:Uncharacterized protein n=1 Tax=Vararia minispora EC-137 TaxID=1314806 RepID=A0ACB8QDB0_9AGAM|nr:hypothetical protein K488DRAFT_55849 [Vararia minispora EC-137]